MGDKPCSVVPSPKRMELRPGRQGWPRRVEVSCRTPLADPFQGRFQNELAGLAGGSLAITLVEGSARAEGYATTRIPVTPRGALRHTGYSDREPRSLVTSKPPGRICTARAYGKTCTQAYAGKEARTA